MAEVKQKLVGFKADINDDKIINIRAQKEGLDKSKFYRRIIDDYFEKNPISQAERTLI